MRWKKVTQKIENFFELEREGEACEIEEKNYFRVINLTLCVLFYHLISVHNLSLGEHKIELTKKKEIARSITPAEILNENANENARSEKCVKEFEKFFLMMSSDEFVGRFRIACRRKPYN